MSTPDLHCDQAIFTSVRSPMGEGYRIISASRGLKPEEKQLITRNSPSHEALCPVPTASADGGAPLAVSFYALPTGRLCVACSLHAGAEHTGRGGQRVYTFNVVFDPSQFAAWCFNPFEIVRAVSAAGLHVPQLKPPPQLDEIRLCRTPRIPRAQGPVLTVRPADGRKGTAPVHVVERLLDHRAIVLNSAGDPLSIAEWILAGIPGPQRAAMSISAGVRFSVSRSHRLQVVFDENHGCREKARGKQLEYVDALDGDVPAASRREAQPDPSARTPERGDTLTGAVPARTGSAWLDMIERCWLAEDLDLLLTRTSRPFPDVSPPARERVGRVYRDLDSLPGLGTFKVLDVVEPHLRSRPSGVEGEIAEELLEASKSALVNDLRALAANDLRAVVRRLAVIASAGERACGFASGPMNAALSALARLDAVGAAALFLDLPTRRSGSRSAEPAPTLADAVPILCEFLGRMVEEDCVESARSNPRSGREEAVDPERRLSLARRLAAAFPDEPATRRCVEQCERAGATAGAAAPS